MKYHSPFDLPDYRKMVAGPGANQHLPIVLSEGISYRGHSLWTSFKAWLDR